MTAIGTLVLWGEGSSQTGLGHLMRLLALGQAWFDAGGRVEALLGEAPEGIVRRYETEGFTVQRLSPTDPSHPADMLADILRQERSTRAGIDRPRIDDTDLARLGEAGARTLLVDDMALLKSYPVGLVLNQNIHADRNHYPAASPAGFLLGPSYVVLRREFRTPLPRRAIPDRGRKLLITFGGADPTGMTMRTVDAVLRLPASTRRHLEVRVILGAAYEGGGAPEAAAKDGGVPMIVERGVEDMVSRMSWADLAVTSGGSTVWELARTACPSLVIETAPAEPLLVAGLGRVGLFDRLGPADRLDDAVLRSAIEARLGDRRWRSEMASRGSQLVDGQGAGRVVDALMAVDAR
jgi:UDP-2,4-diacetamido-2,4,6-trideoxy-beta-L-altropyranose hydrolase